MEHTPVQEFAITRNPVHVIHVKREDLYADFPFPPNAKLRAVRAVLDAEKPERVGVFGSRVSQLPWAVAQECQQRAIACTAYLPSLKKKPDLLYFSQIASAGANVCYVKSGRTPIMYYQARKHARENGSFMFPHGGLCEAGIAAYSAEALHTLSLGEYRSIVLCAGSCTVLVGILAALQKLSHWATRVYAISAGASLETQRRTVNRFVHGRYTLTLVEPLMGYYKPCKVACPFPSNPYYDLKAWMWLSLNIEKLESPVLFWNIGG